MDTYTLALYSTVLAFAIAAALLFCYKYMFAGMTHGIDFIGYASLLLGLSLMPLCLGVTQSDTYIVFFSNASYSVAFGLFLLGIVLLRGASQHLATIGWVSVLGVIAFFFYYTLVEPSVGSRIEARSVLVFTICCLVLYANKTGTQRDDEKARLLLMVTMLINAAYMALRILVVHNQDAIKDYYSVSFLHKLSFVMTTLTVVSLGFCVIWMLTSRLLKRTYLSAITDELTGLYNRTGLKAVLPDVLFSNPRNHYSVMLADLDHFKLVNDTLGHDKGDLVIKHFGRVIYNLCRESDKCFRYGGEEFLVVLPNTNGKVAETIANRVRRSAKKLSGAKGSIAHYTVSIGVTQVQKDDDWNTLIRRVDQALYEAKSNGRDCVVRR